MPSSVKNGAGKPSTALPPEPRRKAKGEGQGQHTSQERGKHTHKKNPGKRAGQGGG